MPPVHTSLILFGCLGGLLPDVLRLIRSRYDGALPAYLRSGAFWLGLALLAVVGGFTAWLAGATEIQQALAYGFGAPEVISRLAANPRSAERALPRGAPSFSLRSWWAR
jgi:hypothetical protein